MNSELTKVSKFFTQCSALQAKNIQNYIQLSDKMDFFFKNASSALDLVNLIPFQGMKGTPKAFFFLTFYLLKSHF